MKDHDLEVGVGLNDVDYLKPSKYFYEITDKSNSYDEIEEKLNGYYKTQDLSKLDIQREKECDIVSIRIAKLLKSSAFTFSPITLKSIHKNLFDGVFEGKIKQYIGKFRTYNITKKEDILRGKSVIYGDYKEILEYLKYDFDNELNVNYLSLNQNEQVENISKFISAIWQIHPFCEGNTRTIAVFAMQYLKSLGYEINNDVFKDNSRYFRDALVISNYADYKNNITPTNEYLYMFFAKFLLDKEIDLKKIQMI